MNPTHPPAIEFEVGKFVCPRTKALVPLRAVCAFDHLTWPLVVEKCPDCGEKHVLLCEEVLHPPLYGYE
jgi:hypothetical protein